MSTEFSPIGYVRSDVAKPPRHWSVSDVVGDLKIDPAYRDGLTDIEIGQQIIVLFHFHKSEPFQTEHLRQNPPHKSGEWGVFSICSPVRPNPIGLSVVEVLAINDSTLRVRGIDMLDGTPILDIKPIVTGREARPEGEAAP